MVKKQRETKFSPDELATARKRDALALAQLIYDIWIEKKSIKKEELKYLVLGYIF